MANSNNKVSQSRRIPVVWVVACCFVVLVALLSLIGTEDSTFCLALILLTLTITPFVVTLSRGTFDMFEPIHPISFIIAFYFALRAIYLVLGISDHPWVSFNTYEDAIPAALWYTILGYLALLAGYYSPLTSRIATKTIPASWRLLERPPFNRVLIIYVVGLSAQVLSLVYFGSKLWQIDADESNLPPYIFIALSNFIFYAMGMTIIRIFKGGTPKKFLYLFWLALLPTTIAQSLIYGGRFFLVAFVVMVLVAYHYVRHRLSLLRVLVATLIVLTTIFPVLRFYREMSGGKIGFVDRLKTAPVEIGRLKDEEVQVLIVNGLMERSHGIDSLALIVKYTPGLGEFKYGQDYLLIPAYAFVPRALWPEKPINTSVEFGLRYFANPVDTQSTPIGQFHIGDLYRNFALPGIIIGMFGLGVFYRAAYLYLAPSKNGTLAVFLYVLFIIFVIQKFEADITSMASELLKTILFLIPSLWFMRRRDENRGSSVLLVTSSQSSARA